MKKSRFESMGVYLPERVVSTQDLINQIEKKPQFDLEKLTGISNRRWRSDSEDSYTLAVSAMQRCLEKSKYKASDLDVIIFCSITHSMGGSNHWFEPSISKFLKDRMGFRPSALNFDMTNACAGMTTGVFILNNMIQSGMAKNGMVVSGECITPIAETAIKEIRDPVDAQFASLTVGDSGAALIMDECLDSDDDGIDCIDFMTLADFSEFCFGMPSKENSGIAMYTDAMGIHREVIQRLPDIVGNFLKKHDLSPSAFDYVIPHQTSSRAIKTALDLCGSHFTNIPETLMSLQKYGNTSSTSHFVVLHDYLEGDKLKKNSRVLIIALASGIVIGLISVKIGGLQESYAKMKSPAEPAA
jgi:3-oxoacyl-[acyl-carrier-protein] synthase-3